MANKKNYKKGTKKTNKRMTDNSSKSVAVSNGSTKTKKKDQQLPAKKASESKPKKQSQRANIFKIFAQFWREAIIELKKVKWPTKKELIASTTMVLVLVLIVALYLGGVDILLSNIIKRIVG